MRNCTSGNWSGDGRKIVDCAENSDKSRKFAP